MLHAYDVYYSVRARGSDQLLARAASPCVSLQTSSSSQALTTISHKYKNVGPEPKRFTIGSGQLLDVSAAARLGWCKSHRHRDVQMLTRALPVLCRRLPRHLCLQ